jgi:hypothetical protein
MTNETATERPFNQPQYWLWWVLATAGGWLVGSLTNFLLSIFLNATNLSAALEADPAEIPPSTALMLMGVSAVLLLIIGLAVGAAQWLVLRQQLPQLKRWVIFTAVGFALGSFAMLAFMGLGVGLMQWLLLRRDLNKTGWWPVMSAVAWPLGYILGGVLGAELGAVLNSPIGGGLLGAALSGAIIGAITGAVLLWMLRENAALLESLRQERAVELVKQ